MPTSASLAPEQAHARLPELTVVDVRTPAEYTAGHIAGSHNVPFEHLGQAADVLKGQAERGEILLVCASGVRSAQAETLLAKRGVAAANLVGGVKAWTDQGYDLEGEATGRLPWAMERQVRLAAGSLVLLGLVAGRRARGARLLSAGVAGGLVFSACTNTCGMARVLSLLPHNRSRGHDLRATLADISR